MNNNLEELKKVRKDCGLNMLIPMSYLIPVLEDYEKRIDDNWADKKYIMDTLKEMNKRIKKLKLESKGEIISLLQQGEKYREDLENLKNKWDKLYQNRYKEMWDKLKKDYGWVLYYKLEQIHNEFLQDIMNKFEQKYFPKEKASQDYKEGKE